MRRLLRLTLANSERENRNYEQGVDGRISKTRESAEKIDISGHARGTEPDTPEEQGSWADDDHNKERLEASLNSCSISLQGDFEDDHADVFFMVAGKSFRCHRAILAARSEYFKARFFRASHSDFERSGSLINDRKDCVLPELEEHDLSASAFKKLLDYIYTDSVEEIDPDDAEETFDAASRYLLFPLKRAVVDVLLPHLERTPAELCRWLLMADMYGVSKLRKHCLDAMALNFELFAATQEFRQVLKALPPPSGGDGARTSAPSGPGEVGRDEQGNLEKNGSRQKGKNWTSEMRVQGSLTAGWRSSLLWQRWKNRKDAQSAMLALKTVFYSSYDI